MKLTSDQAFELSKLFREVSVTLGDYRFSNWDDMKPSERQQLEDLEWSLLNASSDMTTKAVGLVLDETQYSFDQLRTATADAKRALKTLKNVRKGINVATALLGLAAGIMSKDFGAVAKNAKAVYDAVRA